MPTARAFFPGPESSTISRHVSSRILGVHDLGHITLPFPAITSRSREAQTFGEPLGCRTGGLFKCRPGPGQWRSQRSTYSTPSLLTDEFRAFATFFPGPWCERHSLV